MPKYSLITITHNSLKHTLNFLNSIFDFSKDFELIIVDNGSTDGTTEYLKYIEKEKGVKVIYNSQNTTYAKANNQAIPLATGEFIVFINNDTIVSQNWLDNMGKHFKYAQIDNIGIIGPVSNMSNGAQMVKIQDPKQWHEKHCGKWQHTGILYGWCLMVKKEVIEKIGYFDEALENAYEDNDFCLRAQLFGYRLVIAYDTYIYHVGQGTFGQNYDIKKYVENGLKNRERYFNKYQNDKPKKLVAVYRTNAGKYLEKSLEQTSKFADSIIIHFCRANITNDKIELLKRKFYKIIKIGRYDGVFQEDYERNWLLQEALKLHEAGEADWCISIDDDEIYEDKFIERVQKMMNPRNPEIMGYWCQWRTIWENRPNGEYYRKDSTFGQFSNYRFFRLMNGQEIMSKYHPEGHHCGSAPLIASENLRWSNIRVKHLGYETPEQRQKKYEFYETNDHFKTREDIGYDDYSHLISKDVQLEKYDKDNGITLLMMIKNEEDFIREALEQLEYAVDEYVIVDTGSTDKTMDIINNFAKHSIVPFKIFNYPWVDNFSLPRNFGKQYATKKWILFMDADERFSYQDIIKLFYLSESEADAVKFHVLNYMSMKENTENPNIASSESIRLFKNIPELFFNGIIHETIDDSLVTLSIRRKIITLNAPFPLHHHGYLKTKERVREKMDYYEKLNLKQIEITEGKDPRPFFNLGLHYLSDGKDAEGLKFFVKCLEINNNVWHAHQQMAALNINSAKVFLQNALKTMPLNHPYMEQAKSILKFLNENSHGCIRWKDYASTRTRLSN